MSLRENSGRRRTRRGETGAPPRRAREVNYRDLRNPFPVMDVFPADRIAAMHDTALRTLEELGMRVLLPEAVEILRKGGARVEDDMVFIGRDMVAAALASAPKSITGRAGARHRDIGLELGSLVFQAAAPGPRATIVNSRRSAITSMFFR